MEKIRKYFSVLFFCLVVLPVAEKGLHDIGHLNDVNCAVQETHYCETEHHCSVCDYLVKTYSSPPEAPAVAQLFLQFSSAYTEKTNCLALAPHFSGRYLRGPPSLA